MCKDKILSILAIIPARGGSKRVPGKNIRKLAGKPLIAYTIEQAFASKYINRVVVSTEDKKIGEVAARYQAEVIKRPEKLARDDTPSLEVLQHTLRHLEETEGYLPELVVLLQPTSPLRLADDIDSAIEKLLKADCDSVVSVCEVGCPLHWMYTLVGDRLRPITNSRIKKQQDTEKVYRLNGAVYVTSVGVIMRQNRIIGRDTRAYIMPRERSIDIDTELDFKLAELLIKEEHRSPE